MVVQPSSSPRIHSSTSACESITRARCTLSLKAVGSATSPSVIRITGRTTAAAKQHRPPKSLKFIVLDVSCPKGRLSRVGGYAVKG